MIENLDHMAFLSVNADYLQDLCLILRINTIYLLTFYKLKFTVKLLTKHAQDEYVASVFITKAEVRCFWTNGRTIYFLGAYFVTNLQRCNRKAQLS